MIRQLSQCPYCNHCEIALGDEIELVFNPGDSPQAPCVHLAWIDGRFAEWETSDHGIDRVIGSTEFSWALPEAGPEEQVGPLLPYLRELANSGPDWPFAPALPFSLQTLTAEEKTTDKKGRTHTLWDVDGWAVFAVNPSAFWAALPACQERQLGALDVGDNG